MAVCLDCGGTECVCSYNATLRRLKAENERLRGHLAQAHKDLDTFQRRVKELDELKSDNERLRGKVKDCTQWNLKHLQQRDDAEHRLSAAMRVVEAVKLMQQQNKGKGGRYPYGYALMEAEVKAFDQREDSSEAP